MLPLNLHKKIAVLPVFYLIEDKLHISATLDKLREDVTTSPWCKGGQVAMQMPNAKFEIGLSFLHLLAP
jgi:hypothetical protein